MKKAIKDGVHRFALGLLKELESGNFLLVKYDNLAIEKQGDGFESTDGRCNSREFIGAVFLVSGEQADPIIFLISENPVAVVLLLVGPSGPVEWLANERSKHGLNAKWNTVLHGDRFLSSIALTLSWH